MKTDPGGEIEVRIRMMHRMQAGKRWHRVEQDVLEIHHVAGEDCFLIKVRVAGTRAMRQLLQDKLGAIDTIRSTRSTIVLDTVKETSVLPPPVIGHDDD